jgi:hypothetical protein
MRGVAGRGKNKRNIVPPVSIVQILYCTKMNYDGDLLGNEKGY